MSTLYIRLPSRAAAGNAPHWPALVCPFALAAHGGAIEREGAVPLPDLSGAIAQAQRVVLLLAASDVAILRVQAPPLSPARLRAALPGLVEDQLLGDPADCVIVAGDSSGGLRTVAVAQRAWLDTLSGTFSAFGARRIAALPAQLCLPYQPDCVTAAINEQGADIDVALRLSAQDGIGLTIDAGRNETAAREVIQTLCAVAPKMPISLCVPQPAVQAYQEAASHINTPNERINVLADNWPRWIAGANGVALDLMAGLGATATGLEWRAWRWPLALAAMILIVNVTALNVDWWRMKSEANSLRASMAQIYKAAYPKETVIIDPIAQMQQKIAIAKRDSGLAAPDDFMAITAAFGEAWVGVIQMAGKTAPSVAALEYRERSLFVRLKTGIEAPTQQMKTALAMHNLSLDLAPAQSNAVVWQIRSGK